MLRLRRRTDTEKGRKDDPQETESVQSDGRGAGKARPGSDSERQSALSVIDFSLALSLVFGGCCTNVVAYEDLLKMNRRIGSALTFSQALFITVQALPGFLDWTHPDHLPRLKKRTVPLRVWGIQVLLSTTGSLLNNWVFAFNIPLTVQIVFRSAGLSVSMLFGYLFLKKRYSLLQVFSVLLVSLGVGLATISKPSATAAWSQDDSARYFVGISMLVFSLFVTGTLGLLQERTYKEYGPCWKEGVFYTHFLSLPFYSLLAPDIIQGFRGLSTVPAFQLYPYVVLTINLFSQLFCVSGVNKLTSQVSSVSTNLILTVRKALSLCISVWWFQNGWNADLVLGASLVFIGSMLFAL
ncbi:hypothetical protein SERLA73DRAFT_191396 [Serpula lacrymans var. lacrymans S7.3]|uniref:Sugar phosphate transporter domain-containing protein n=2 Tax=Serpula lacrymans var. lacrymans TaxID=341189 RepID=F8QHG3_SERL3|nr:uncharacterized protein SERLADRAFT_472780 [Serpula lacrymans var. lacrymans S7.9]EGN92273.1 hypothetical protein SERLA73DRAFT_191396 [Serpula lacrymans var. lacrymans S7.3]EGO22238.1 hypothetical protein SERLADRAFT_472780 [Serpula lacrymans var. lacrymans S7.9]